jgi:NAD(P)-dependent dehydrogenase (short-subunit alcohol dehydrogenase family)
MLKNSENGIANIINVASISGLINDNGQFLYSVAKSGLIHYTKITQKELNYLRCNCISPGVVETPIFGHIPPEKAGMFDFEVIENMLPAKRLGQPEDIAKLALFLVSAEGSYIAGANIVIDGGHTVLIT